MCKKICKKFCKRICKNFCKQICKNFCKRICKKFCKMCKKLCKFFLLLCKIFAKILHLSNLHSVFRPREDTVSFTKTWQRKIGIRYLLFQSLIENRIVAILDLFAKCPPSLLIRRRSVCSYMYPESSLPYFL